MTVRPFVDGAVSAAWRTRLGAMLALVAVQCLNLPPSWAASDQSAELAQKLANPVASLISVPIKLDWDTGIGPKDADRYAYVVQPVIPINLNAEWNLITRTIMPIIDAKAAIPGGHGESGVGDILQSFFFSPAAPTASGWLWGAGPVFLYPSASNDAVGSEKWAAGPTAVVLRQTGSWTYGILANHQWSFAGSAHRSDVDATFLQPFVAYMTRTYTTFTVNTESTYDWTAEQWTVPVNASVSQVLKVGQMPLSIGAGVRAYADTPRGGPDWGLRLTLTFMFPK